MSSCPDLSRHSSSNLTVSFPTNRSAPTTEADISQLLSENGITQAKLDFLFKMAYKGMSDVDVEILEEKTNLPTAILPQIGTRIKNMLPAGEAAHERREEVRWEREVTLLAEEAARRNAKDAAEEKVEADRLAAIAKKRDEMKVKKESGVIGSRLRKELAANITMEQKLRYHQADRQFAWPSCSRI